MVTGRLPVHNTGDAPGWCHLQQGMALPPLFAHRLGRAYGPDSSIAALERALAGADGVEADACLTADEQLVLLHDPLLSLATSLDGCAHQRSLHQIRRRGCC
jgi:glycerophosphoryl diester phosphodiesterase